MNPSRRDLWTIEHPPTHVAQQRLGILGCTFAEQITDDDFGQRINRQPQIAVSLLGWMVVLHMMLFLLNEAPGLINLDERNLEITEVLVMQAMTALADPQTEPHDGVSVDVSES